MKFKGDITDYKKLLKQNQEEFWAKIEELTDKNKFLACIEMLESIPYAERDYKISYELARAYQNFAIIGEDEKETEYELGSEFLLKSISILESVREEGEDKAEWNMRMAYAFQYLENKEEFAISYALRWSEFDPSDKNALEVVNECKEGIKNRVKKQILSKAYEIVKDILKGYQICGANDYLSRDEKELEKIDKEIELALKDYALDEEDIVDVIEDVLADLDNAKEDKKKGDNMQKINHGFFGELDLKNGLGDYDVGDTIVLWEEEIKEINTTLWYVRECPITTGLLDIFAKFLNNFDKYDKEARKALERYLTRDDGYIVFHKEEAELDVPEDAQKFAQSMSVTNIGLWVDGENLIIVDYMISPDESDEILAVKFDSDFKILDIAWES